MRTNILFILSLFTLSFAPACDEPIHEDSLSAESAQVIIKRDGDNSVIQSEEGEILWSGLSSELAVDCAEPRIYYAKPNCFQCDGVCIPDGLGGVQCEGCHVIPCPTN